VIPKPSKPDEPRSTKGPEPIPEKEAPAIPFPTPESPLPAESTGKLRAELDQAKDRILRLQAELDNVHKRSARELHDQLRYANMGLLRDLLPVLDNARRAIEAAEKGADIDALLDGFRMLAQQLEGVLARHHCEKIEALHEPFDPHSHEAITQQPSAEHPPQTVILVHQDGYRLHDRVVRPSQVIVSSAPKEPEIPK
jgi:molecular chaperone GrpE